MNFKAAKEIDDALALQRKETADTLISYSIPAHIAGDVAASKTLNLAVDWNLVQKEAIVASNDYGYELRNTGKIKIPKTIKKDGKEVFAGYKKYDLLANAEREERAKIHKIIHDGLKEGKPVGYKEWIKGKGYPEGSIAAELNEHFNARKSHAALVARTETGRIQGMGMKTRYRKSGIRFGRWKTVGDLQVRPEHTDRELAGIYPIDEIPSIGEPNCRCTIIPVTDQEAEEAGMLVPDETPKTPKGPQPIMKDRYDSEGAFKFFKENRVEGEYGIPRSDGDLYLERIYTAQGFHAKPLLLEEGAFADYNGSYHFLRGVSSQNHVDDILYGEKHYAGNGIHGNGTYTAYGSDKAAIAKSYAGLNRGEQVGRVMEGKFATDAKIIKEEDIVKYVEEFKVETNAVKLTLRKKVNRLNAEIEDATGAELKAMKAELKEAEKDLELARKFEIAMLDEGRFAAMLGYDAIDDVDDAYLIVLNRGKMAMKIPTKNKDAIIKTLDEREDFLKLIKEVGIEAEIKADFGKLGKGLAFDVKETLTHDVWAEKIIKAAGRDAVPEQVSADVFSSLKTQGHNYSLRFSKAEIDAGAKEKFISGDFGIKKDGCTLNYELAPKQYKIGLHYGDEEVSVYIPQHIKVRRKANLDKQKEYYKGTIEAEIKKNHKIRGKVYVDETLSRTERERLIAHYTEHEKYLQTLDEIIDVDSRFASLLGYDGVQLDDYTLSLLSRKKLIVEELKKIPTAPEYDNPIMALTGGKCKYTATEARKEILNIKKAHDKKIASLLDKSRDYEREIAKLTLREKELKMLYKEYVRSISDDPSDYIDASYGWLSRHPNLSSKTKDKIQKWIDEYNEISRKIVDDIVGGNPYKKQIKVLEKGLIKEIHEKVIFHTDGSSNKVANIARNEIKNPELKARFDEGINFLNRTVIMNENDRLPPITVGTFKRSDRGMGTTAGCYIDDRKTIRLMQNRATLESGRKVGEDTGNYNVTGTKTVVHEIGHYLEYHKFSVKKSCEYLDRVCEPEIKHLSKIDPNWEWCKNDPYMVGKASNTEWCYTTRIYDECAFGPHTYREMLGDTTLYSEMAIRATEVISVGVEQMYMDPCALAKYPEYFEYIWNTVKGLE